MKNSCNTGSGNCGRVLGAIFLVAATILTFIHVGSEGGTLGMFIAAAVLLKRSGGCGSCERCGVCACCCACVASECGSSLCEPEVKPKKASAKPRKAKKTA